jgi:type IV pilus assembly protein PilP
VRPHAWRTLVAVAAVASALYGAARAYAETFEGEDPNAYTYDPAGKRDPFLPLYLLRRPAAQTVEPATPLQRYEIGQLRLVGVVFDLTPPRAMVEDSSGLGFIVTPGTAIGPNGGVVTAIRPRQVVVEEWQTDIIGEKHKKEFVLELPSDERGKSR